MKVIVKPWGKETIWFKSGNIQFKTLHIRKGEETSLQYHKNKTETIIPLDDNCILEYRGKIGEYSLIKKVNIGKGETHLITSGYVHRFIAVEKDTVLAELGAGLDSDIVRLEDKYKRK
jgi:mannose-6-phosphate isomerase-like protein (cupin superfamily)